MAKAKPEWEHKLMQSKWAFFVLAGVFLAISYGFACLAINYGSYWQYILSIAFLIWAGKEIHRGVRNLRNH